MPSPAHANATRPGVSLESPAVESQFLSRELGVEWTQVTADEFRETVLRNAIAGERTLVIASGMELYTRLLREAPARSLDILLLSDEGYSPQTLRVLRGSASVARVFRNYPATPAPWREVVKQMLHLAGGIRGATVTAFDVIKNCAIGIRSRFRMWRWRSLKCELHAVPLGYTSKFANALINECQQMTGEMLPPMTSLFQAGLSAPSLPRDISVSFRGVRGEPQRRIAIDWARSQPASDVVVFDATWSGASQGGSGSDYVRALLRSQRTLCAPGYVNNESFRYYEALICGSMPIEASTSVRHMGRLIARPDDERAGVSVRLELVRAELTRIRLLLLHSIEC